MKKIVIVGGGIAGLSAANFLVRAGFEVVLLEAKKYFGGRIKTLTLDGSPIELGAEFLHGENPSILNVIQAAGLSTHSISENYQSFEQRRLKPVDLLDKVDRLINQINIHKDDCSFQDFLDEQQLKDTDREQAISFVHGFHAAYPNRISAQALRRGEYSAAHMGSAEQSRINEGYGALVAFLEKEIQAHGGKILSNAIVRKVTWERGRVEITYHQGVLQTIEADAAVITLPLGVLKAGTVRFQPPLTAKKDAIEQLHFGNVVKMVFEFRKPCWPDFGFIIAHNEVFPTWWTDPRGPILTGWAGGPDADILLECSLLQLEQLGLDILGRFFPKQADDLRTQFISAHTFNWSNDPFTYGAYSYLPVNGLDLPKLLGAPMADTLFFAGEATVADAQTGTVFSAYETGLRAGREILANFADTSPEAIFPLQR